MKKPDRRIEKTKSALRRAFAQLFFERAYAQITIGDIVARANVGRSTFYEHYQSKDAMLNDGASIWFAALATVVDEDADMATLHGVLDHFWLARSKARNLQAPSVRRSMVRILAQLIQERLQRRVKHMRATVNAARLNLISHTLAEALLGTIVAWLAGDLACDDAVLREALFEIAQNAARQLIPPL